jgi:hypothetical protein
VATLRCRGLSRGRCAAAPLPPLTVTRAPPWSPLDPPGVVAGVACTGCCWVALWALLGRDDSLTRSSSVDTAALRMCRGLRSSWHT